MGDKGRLPNGGGLAALALGIAILAGCKGIATKEERAAVAEFSQVEKTFRPSMQRPDVSLIRTNGALTNLIAFAMLNQPKVEAAYYDWAAATRRIAVERSLPDPRLTFQTDISDIVMSLMPGLMWDLPGPGKLRLRGAAAATEADAKYFAFESAAYQTAAGVKRAFYQLHFLQEKLRITRETQRLVEELETVARKQHEVGKVTLQDVLRAQIEESRLRTEIANMEDSGSAFEAQFRGALGLAPSDREPVAEGVFETTPLTVDTETLLASAFGRNPRLKGMEAEVRRAEALLRLAHKSRTPDFNVGLEVDAKANPLLFNPQAGMTLPIWRDKIAAELAEAQALKSAAQARLTAEQIMIAIELAEKAFMFREATRNLTLYAEALLPKARLSLDVARSSYLTGRTDFFNLIDAWRTLLGFEISEVEARTQRELTLTELSLLIAAEPPEHAPFSGAKR